MSFIRTKLTAGILALAVIAGVSATQAEAGGPGHAHGAIKLGLKGQVCHGGMQLVYVEPGSLACQLGLRPGDIIYAINRVKIHCANDYFAGLHQAVFHDHGCLKIGIYRANHCGQLRRQLVKAQLPPQVLGAPQGLPVQGVPGQGFPQQGLPAQGAPIQGFQGQQGAPIQGLQGQQIPGQQLQGQQFPGQQFQGQQIPGQQGQQFPGQQFQGQQFQGQQFQGQQGQQIPGQQLPGQQFPGQQLPGQQIPGQQFPGQQQGAPQQQGAGQNIQGFTVSANLLQRAR